MDKEQIEKQAKQILDKFAKALEKVEKEDAGESYVDREEFERVEGRKAGSESEDSEALKNADFKKAMLKNAPEHDEDFVLVEKGKWK